MKPTPHQKIVLVTGANRGIGRSIVDTAIESGAAKVYTAVRDPDSASELIERYGSVVHPIRIDLDSPETIDIAASQATDVDIVINNAGIMRMKTVLDQDSIDALADEMRINTFGLMRMAQAFAPILRKNGGGALVQINSVASVRASAAFATYCASKAACYSITQSLKDQLADQGTLVVSVHPGPTQSDMGTAAGFQQIGTPACEVASTVFDAIDARAFHAWVGPLAELVSESYISFSQTMIEGDMAALRDKAFS